MSDDQVQEVIELLGGYFPSFTKITEAEERLWRSRLRQAEYLRAKDAVEGHKLSTKYDRVTFPDIFERVRQREFNDAPAQRENAKAPGLADMLRQMFPEHSGRSDYELILRYHRQLWHRARRSIEATLPEWRASADAGYRKQIRESCAGHLAGAGMVRPEGDGFSADWADHFAAKAFIEDPWEWDEAMEELKSAQRMAGSYVPDRPPRIEVPLRAVETAKTANPADAQRALARAVMEANAALADRAERSVA